MTTLTGVASTSSPRAIAFITSRSVMMPMSSAPSITSSDPVCCAHIRAAAARMWAQQTGSLLVMDGAELIGIITERDVMKAIARGLDVEATPVSVVMTRHVQTVTPYALV